MGPKNAPSGDKNHDIFHPDIIIYDIFFMILTWVLGTGSDKVKGQSDTFLTAGSVFCMCKYGTLDSQRWYVQCSKNL